LSIAKQIGEISCPKGISASPDKWILDIHSKE
jgi:hypothetical protein